MRKSTSVPSATRNSIASQIYNATRNRLHAEKSSTTWGPFERIKQHTVNPPLQPPNNHREVEAGVKNFFSPVLVRYKLYFV